MRNMYRMGIKMSRSKKGSKGPGYDYWSKRPHSGMGHGPEVKKLTHSVERQQAKAEVEAGLEAVAEAVKENWNQPPITRVLKHNWSGFPGAYCLNCGVVTDDYRDPETGDVEGLPDCAGPLDGHNPYKYGKGKKS